MTNNGNSQRNTKNELEFRLWFKGEFGIDYLEATKKIQVNKIENERLWQQLLVSRGVI